MFVLIKSHLTNYYEQYPVLIVMKEYITNVVI